jgi:hypothetical protein
MKRIPFFITLLLLSISSYAQDYISYFNQEDFWKSIVVDKPGTRPTFNSSDTVIIVASNRRPVWGSVRFMSELSDRDSVRYFVVYTRHNTWHVLNRTSLTEAISTLPERNRDWVVYTEGMGKVFTADLDRGIRLAGQYGVNVLLLDYPSIHSGYKSYRNYLYAYSNSIISYKSFVPTLDSFKMLRMQHKAGEGHLTLFFHSMGNNLIRKIEQSRISKKYNDVVWVDNVLLNAPCVPRRRSKQWIDNIHFARRVYVHYNPYDQTLKWARVAGFRQVLGEHAKKQVSKNATYINFNPLCGSGHSNFMQLYGRSPARPEAVAHYSKLFHGEDVNVKDSLSYRKSAYRGVGWDIMPRVVE